MSTPVVQWDDDEKPPPAVTWDDAPVPAPASTPAPSGGGMSSLEAFSRGQSRGALLGWSDEAQGRIQSGVRKLFGADVPRAERGTGGAPVSEYTAIRDDERRLADEARGTTAGKIGEGFGALTTSAPLMAVNPAGTAARIAANTAIGAGSGFVTGAGESEAEDSLQALSDAGESAMWSGGISAAFPIAGKVASVVRALPSRAIAAASRVRTAGAPPSVTATAAEALDPGTAGREFRAAAARGEMNVDDATRTITDAVSDTERYADQILDASGVGMKRAPIARHMKNEGVNASNALSASDDVVESVWSDVDGMMENATGSGRAALRGLLGGDNTPGAIDRAIANMQRVAPDDAEGAAVTFSALDQLKREIGRAVRRSGRGTTADPNTEEALKGLYERLRVHLQDPSVWGEGASRVQSEVNAAWVPYIRKNKGLEALAKSDIRGLQGADPWEVISEGDPAKVKSILSRAGTVENELNEKALREGLTATGDISGALAKHYDIPPDVAARAEEIRARVGTVSNTLDKTIADASAARRLGELGSAAASPVVEIPILTKSTPNPANAARAMGAIERGDSLGALSRGASGIAKARQALPPSGVAVPAMSRAFAAGSGATTEPPPQAAQSMAPADVLAAIESDPQAFGALTPAIRQAAESGDQETIDWAMSQIGR